MKLRNLSAVMLVAICAATYFLIAAPVLNAANNDESSSSSSSSSSTSSSSSSSSSCPHGCRGPRGFQGPPGVCECVPSFLSVFSTTSQFGILEGDALVLDQFAIPTQGSDMTYNNINGTVTFHRPGFYEVSYGISVLFDNAVTSAQFAANMTPGGIVPGSALNVTVRELLENISFIVQVTAAGQTMQIISRTSIDCGSVATVTATGCNDDAPVLAYIIVKKVS